MNSIVKIVIASLFITISTTITNVSGIHPAFVAYHGEEPFVNIRNLCYKCITRFTVRFNFSFLTKIFINFCFILFSQIHKTI